MTLYTQERQASGWEAPTINRTPLRYNYTSDKVQHTQMSTGIFLGLGLPGSSSPNFRSLFSTPLLHHWVCSPVFICSYTYTRLYRHFTSSFTSNSGWFWSVACVESHITSSIIQPSALILFVTWTQPDPLGTVWALIPWHHISQTRINTHTHTPIIHRRITGIITHVLLWTVAIVRL